MKIIHTHEMDPTALTDFEREMVYNGLDVLVTRDAFDALHPQLDPTTAATYALSLSLQAPVLEMGLRGVLVDQFRRSEAMEEIYATMDRLEKNLNRIVFEGIGLPSFNWRSHADLRKLFYDELGIPPVRKGGRPTTDRSARERLEVYPVAQQLVKHINLLTELGDKLSVLKTEIDNDGRIRTSYNIAGTRTGRFSSSLSEFGTGGNLQNIEESLRSVFISDGGFKFAKCDAKSGESYCVGAIEWNLFNDGRYLDACESGDPHTAVARICWPKLPWTGQLAADKDLAQSPFYRHHSYRDMCKKLGHGSNYGGKPQTLAEQTRLPINIVTEFQEKYNAEFPAHQRWQQHVLNTLWEKGCLTSLMGRKRWFFGRRSEPKTYRDALAFDPQSSLVDIVNTAMLRVWRQGIAIVMMHDHDALTFMYREEDEAKVIPALMKELIVEVRLEGSRTLRIPYDCKVGWNKGEYNEGSNPNGLLEYRGPDARQRQKTPGILDRIVRRSYG